MSSGLRRILTGPRHVSIRQSTRSQGFLPGCMPREPDISLMCSMVLGMKWPEFLASLWRRWTIVEPRSSTDGD